MSLLHRWKQALHRAKQSLPLRLSTNVISSSNIINDTLKSIFVEHLNTHMEWCQLECMQKGSQKG